MGKKKYIFIGLLIVVSIVCAFAFPRHNDVYKKGVPDLVSSHSFADNVHYEDNLTVVANADSIKDQEKFARNIVQMCIDNSFHSIKFSLDVNGYPNRFTARVYHWREDIEDHSPLFTIKYKPMDSMNYECTIADGITEYNLYIDNQLIKQ